MRENPTNIEAHQNGETDHKSVNGHVQIHSDSFLFQKCLRATDPILALRLISLNILKAHF